MQRLSVFWINLHKRVLGSFWSMYFGGKPGLYREVKSVSNGDFVAINPAIVPIETQSSYGFNLLNHLTTDRACLLRGEVTVVALGKIYADFVCSFHLKTVKSFSCLGNYCFRHVTTLLCFVVRLQ